jgi:hypothetical protein
MKNLLVGLLIATILFFSSCSPKSEITTGTLLKEMINRDQLAEFPDPEYTTKQFSSYDRKSLGPDQPGWFANADRSQFVRTENNNGRRELIMFDSDGPGAIVRFWVTVALYQGNGTLRIYLDHNPVPVLEGEVLKLMSGGGLVDAPLSTSVSDLTDYLQRGHNLYLPIPYSQHCKITYESEGVSDQPGGVTGEAFYYNINYRTYTENVSVASFSIEDLSSYAGELNLVQTRLSHYDNTLPENIQSQEHKKITLSPEQVAEIELEGTKAIRQIKIKLNTEEIEQALRSTVLEIQFDGKQTVWCPVGDFFGTGYKISPYKTWYAQVDEDGSMECSWVMPFSTSGKIGLKNYGSQNVTIEEFTVKTTDYDWTDRSMYFGAGWREDDRIATRHKAKGNNDIEDEMFDVNYVSLIGKGVLVGNGVVLFNTTDAWWGEGDEKIFVDGEKFPSHFGTGTEDFYGYAWSNLNNFSHPFIAQPDGAGAMASGYVSNMRFRSLDAIPFKQSLRFDMEIWHQASTTINHAPVSFWYMFPEGETNLKPAPEQAASPVALSRLDFYLEGYTKRNIFTDEVLVTIDGRENGFEIRYTQDGTAPTKNSRLYQGPFKLNKSTVVKSKGFSPKGYETQILEGEFINQKPIAGVRISSPQKGLKYDYYEMEHVLQSTGELNALEIKSSGTIDSIKFPFEELPDQFGVIYTGYVKVKRTGIYTFYTISNDGSVMYINDQQVVDNDGHHGARERQGQIAIRSGYHPIKLEYKQIGGGKHLEVFMEGPDMPKHELLPSELAY